MKAITYCKLTLLLFSFLGFFSSSILASGSSCQSKLLKNYVSDSAFFQIHSEEAGELFESRPRQASLLAVKLLSKNLGCGENELGELIVYCQKIAQGVYHSQVCYARSHLGYFFISMDMMFNINIVFNRYD